MKLRQSLKVEKETVYFGNLIRLIVGAVFIFSGAVKGIDPMGTVYKFEDYFAALGLNALVPYSLYFVLFLNAVEFAVGVALTVKWRVRAASWAAFAFLLVFTPLTLWLFRTNAVSDCGCFGDAVKLSNKTTFYKNVVLLLMTVYLVVNARHFRSYLRIRWECAGGALVFLGAIGWQAYTLSHLPVLDFRPWKIGNNIPAKMEEVAPKVEYTFIYRRISDGTVCNFNMDEVSGLSTDEYEFIDRKEKVITPGIPAEIQDFTALDKTGFDNALDLIMNPQFQFLVISSDFANADPEQMRKVSAFGKDCLAGQNYIAFITPETPSDDALVKKYGLTIPLYYGDQIALKVPVRANPGVILMKDGYVLDKWNARQLPSYAEIKARFPKYDRKLAAYKQAYKEQQAERTDLPPEE